jgi:hypothetical protein
MVSDLKALQINALRYNVPFGPQNGLQLGRRLNSAFGRTALTAILAKLST